MSSDILFFWRHPIFCIVQQIRFVYYWKIKRKKTFEALIKGEENGVAKDVSKYPEEKL